VQGGGGNARVDSKKRKKIIKKFQKIFKKLLRIPNK
jgi:hypothetical protein